MLAQTSMVLALVRYDPEPRVAVEKQAGVLGAQRQRGVVEVAVRPVDASDGTARGIFSCEHDGGEIWLAPGPLRAKHEGSARKPNLALRRQQRQLTSRVIVLFCGYGGAGKRCGTSIVTTYVAKAATSRTGIKMRLILRAIWQPIKARRQQLTSDSGVATESVRAK